MNKKIAVFIKKADFVDDVNDVTHCSITEDLDGDDSNVIFIQGQYPDIQGIHIVKFSPSKKFLKLWTLADE